MTETAKLQAYIAGIKDYPDDGQWSELALVIADSAEAAARLAYPGFDDSRIANVVAGEDNTYTVERCPQGDPLAAGEPRVMCDVETFRFVGFHWEDEDECDGCGEWSEDVCSDCNCCRMCRDPECETCEGK